MNANYKMKSLLTIYRKREDVKFCKPNVNPAFNYPFFRENIRNMKEANVHEVVWVKYRGGFSAFLEKQVDFYTHIEYANRGYR